jgi:hypothetical protein
LVTTRYYWVAERAQDHDSIPFQALKIQVSRITAAQAVLCHRALEGNSASARSTIPYYLGVEWLNSG